MKFLGVTILQGVEFSIFPIDFEWALQQCSATALPVICELAQCHYTHKTLLEVIFIAHLMALLPKVDRNTSNGILLIIFINHIMAAKEQ